MVHLPDEKEQVFPHVPEDLFVVTELGDLTVRDAPDATLNDLPTCGQQIKRIHVELQARKQLRSISDPVAYRPFLPVSDFQENILIFTYFQPIGKDFRQFFASSSRDSSRN